MAGYVGDFACAYGKKGRSQRQKIRNLVKLGVPYWQASRETVEKPIGESQIVRFYTERSATLSGEAEGLEVYMTVMNFCVINLS